MIDFTTLAFGNYSTSEVETKFTYHDGKAIYKKTINIGSLPNNTTKQVAHGISTIDTIVSMAGSAKSSTTEFPLPFTTNVLASQVGIIRNGANIEIFTGNDRTAFTGYVTVYYTKV